MHKNELRLEHVKLQAYVTAASATLIMMFFGTLGLLPTLLMFEASFDVSNLTAKAWLWMGLWSLLSFMFTVWVGIILRRNFKNYSDRKHLVHLTKEGVAGYNASGKARFLSWNEIKYFEVQRRYKNILIYGTNEDASFMAKSLTYVFDYWNPSAIVIPIAYTKYKASVIEASFLALNPYAQDRFTRRH